MSDARAKARELSARIGSFADPALRVRYLRYAVRQMNAEDIADLATVAVHGTEARDPAHAALLLSLCVALADDACAELRGSVALAAAAQGQLETSALFSRAADARALDEAPAVPDFGAARPLTLGERKSLARRRDRDLLARVLRDPHPDVIRILLGNPALTEDDVVRLCAQRPIEPAAVREVFRSTRWVVRYRVRRAIVNNPFAPSDVALQLALHLDASDARAVAASSELPARVREACRRVAGLTTLH